MSEEKAASAGRARQRWRISRAELETMTLIPGNEWHPLDGAPAPEYVPPQWDGPHVGLRLIQAFKTLAAMPNRTLTGIGSYWPEYWHDWADLLAREEMEQAQKEQEARSQNRVRIRPTAQEVSRMETAIVWPGRYLGSMPQVSRVVQRVAVARSRELDIGYVARRLRRNPKQVRAENRLGLDVIAEGLRRDVVHVF